MEVNCAARAKSKALECDENCEKVKQNRTRERSDRERLQREQEEAENQRALEEYEKKFGPKKYRERKRTQVEETKEANYLLYGLVSGGILLVAVMVYFVLVN